MTQTHPTPPLFRLGHLVMTAGVAGLPLDIRPYIRRHQRGDWGDLDDFDQRQNDLAVQHGHRILSVYNAPLPDGSTARIYIITEHDRSVTTALLPEEY